MSRKNKIQHLLISHLLEEGQIELKLPDGMILELGILKEGKYGNLEKKDNYCWLIASQKDREVSMDSFNLGLRFSEDTGKILFEDKITDDKGRPTILVDVI